MGMTTTNISMAQAKVLLQDKVIDKKDAKKLGISKQEADALTKALQGNKKDEVLSRLVKEGHISQSAQTKQSTKSKTAKTVAVAKKTNNNTFMGSLLRKVGCAGAADFLEDKDKTCTDGHNDGKLSLKEGAKSVAKGFFGGLIKTAVNHPVATLATVAAGTALVVATGGAAAPLLWTAGTVLAGGAVVANGVKYAKAKTDGEAKKALEGIGTGASGLVLSGLTYSSTMNAATKVGVKTNTSFLNTLKSSAKVSARNAKANTQTWLSAINGENVVYPNSNKFNSFEKDIIMTKDPRTTGYSNTEVVRVPSGTKIKMGNNVKVMSEDTYLAKSWTNDYYKPSFGVSGHEVTLDGEYIVGSKSTLANKMFTEILAKDALQEQKYSQSLDQALMRYGVRYIGREAKPDMADQIIITQNGQRVVIDTKGYYNSNDNSLKEDMLEFLKTGNRDFSKMY